MFDLSGFPAAEVQYNRDAHLVGTDQDVLGLAGSNLTDLIFVNHGWNNDMADARHLYERLTASMRNRLGSAGGLATRKIGVACLFWPSKRFADPSLIPGNAAGVGSPMDDGQIRQMIDDLQDVFTKPEELHVLDDMAKEVLSLTDKASARRRFVELARTLVDADEPDSDIATSNFFTASTDKVVEQLAKPILLVPPRAEAPVAASLGSDQPDGTAAGFSSLLGGFLGGARNLLNFTTYYEMKNRAGNIGERGLAPLLAKVHKAHPDLRLHLVGHSFGGRLAAAAAKALPRTPRGPLATITLLQAAFSHYGFSGGHHGVELGFFRPAVVNQAVRGPVLITHTGNDKAVGIMYAIASRLAGQDSAGVGDANDRFGGIGRNGAQETAEAVPGTLLPADGTYTWTPQALHNLRADTFIAGHSNVTGEQVAHAIVSAIAAT